MFRVKSLVSALVVGQDKMLGSSNLSMELDDLKEKH